MDIIVLTRHGGRMPRPVGCRWMVSFMMQRRTDEQTALTAEYALYLVDIRGVEFALTYLDTCNVSRSILTRALQSPDSRRHHERRQRPRND